MHYVDNGWLTQARGEILSVRRDVGSHFSCTSHLYKLRLGDSSLERPYSGLVQSRHYSIDQTIGKINRLRITLGLKSIILSHERNIEDLFTTLRILRLDFKGAIDSGAVAHLHLTPEQSEPAYYTY